MGITYFQQYRLTFEESKPTVFVSVFGEQNTRVNEESFRHVCVSNAKSIVQTENTDLSTTWSWGCDYQRLVSASQEMKNSHSFGFLFIGF